MKDFKQYVILNEELTSVDLKQVEKFADNLFAKVGIDVDIAGRHFRERVNDSRNGKEITVAELIGIFKKTFKKFGKYLGKAPEGLQAVIKNLNNDLNMPFMLKYDAKNDEVDLIAKTIMRKRNFMTSNKVFTVK